MYIIQLLIDTIYMPVQVFQNHAFTSEQLRMMGQDYPPLFSQIGAKIFTCMIQHRMLACPLHLQA